MKTFYAQYIYGDRYTRISKNMEVVLHVHFQPKSGTMIESIQVIVKHYPEFTLVYGRHLRVFDI